MSFRVKDRLLSLRGRRNSASSLKQQQQQQNSERDVQIYATMRNKRERSTLNADSFKENISDNKGKDNIISSSSPRVGVAKPLPSTPQLTKKPLPPPPPPPPSSSSKDTHKTRDKNPTITIEEEIQTKDPQLTPPRGAEQLSFTKDCRSPSQERSKYSPDVWSKSYSSSTTSSSASIITPPLLITTPSSSTITPPPVTVTSSSSSLSTSSSSLSVPSSSTITPPPATVTSSLSLSTSSSSLSVPSSSSSLKKRPSTDVIRNSPSTSPKKPRLSKQISLSEINVELKKEKSKICKDVEEVLRVISSHQKGMFPQPGIQQDDETLREIRTDVKILAKAFKCFSHPNANEDPTTLFALTSKESIETTLFQIAKQLIHIKSVVEKTESTARVDALGNFVTYIKKYLTSGELPSDMPQVPMEMAISLINYNHNTDEVLTTLKGTQYKRGFLKKQGRALRGMHRRYKKPFQGGSIVSSTNDEQWVFNKEGVLTNKAWGEALEYPEDIRGAISNILL